MQWSSVREFLMESIIGWLGVCDTMSSKPARAVRREGRQELDTEYGSTRYLLGDVCIRSSYYQEQIHKHGVVH